VTYGSTIPRQIELGFTPYNLQEGNGGFCDISESGDLRCWGDNTYGELGDGTKTSRLTPVVIDSGVKYKKVSMATNHACGVTTTGLLKCWGLNSSGQLGDGTTVDKYVPTLTSDSSTLYKDVSVGYSYSCAVTKLGKIKCFGFNGYYQVGDGTSVNKTNPTLIDSSETYSSVDLGYNHACAITSSDGSLKCWGVNTNRNLGDGTTTTRTTPIVVDSSFKYLSVVASYNGFTCGITTDHDLRCFGNNSSGQLGINSLTTSDPVTVDSGVKYQSVSAYNNWTCAITTDGELKCFGNNGAGQAGNGIASDLSWAIPHSIY
jgi:alpha-tubulin suppressor-like RCC1 family protein